MKKLLILTLLSIFAFNLNAASSNSNNPSSSSVEITSRYGEQATMTFKNKSNYTLTVKVMKYYGGLYSSVTIPAGGSRSIGFSSSGSFYTKLRFSSSYEDIYKIDRSGFSVTNDGYQYSEGTITYYMSASNSGSSAGSPSNKREFEND